MQVVERWVLAPLRKRRFFSLEELNPAIAEQVALVNERRFRGQPISRGALFEELEQPALQTKHLEFLTASRCLGASHWRMIRTDILPAIVSPLLFFSTLETSRMILLGAGLSFLGLGEQPPVSRMGRMISDGRSVLPLAPHVATIPGLAIFLVALAMNTLGDGLREAVDPRLDLSWQQAE